MKKVTSYSLIALFIFALALSSCKSHERCPAYTKATPAASQKAS